MYNKTRQFIEQHERALSFGALVFGFIVDNLTLSRVDVWFDNLILAFYIFCVGTAIFVLSRDVRETRWGRLLAQLQRFAPFVMQFAFGGLFSGFFVFYSRSGSLETSGLFWALLVGLLIGNEFFRSRYERLSFQLAIYFVAVFSYMTFLLPVLVKRMGDGIFFASTLLSVMVMFVFLRTLERAGGVGVTESRVHARRNIIVITLVCIGLYANNLIPPLPLALKDGGVYHSVVQAGRTFVLEGEARTWRDRFSRTPTIHIVRGETLSAYSAVFAPTALQTKVVHHWQFYNPVTEAWESRAKIAYTITGGRDGGYRGYSLKTNMTAGLWRIDIETEDGRVIGRMKRRVVLVDRPATRVRITTE